MLKVLLPEVAGQNLAFLLHNLVKHPVVLRKVIKDRGSSRIFKNLNLNNDSLMANR